MINGEDEYKKHIVTVGGGGESSNSVSFLHRVTMKQAKRATKKQASNPTVARPAAAKPVATKNQTAPMQKMQIPTQQTVSMQKVQIPTVQATPSTLVPTKPKELYRALCAYIAQSEGEMSF